MHMDMGHGHTTSSYGNTAHPLKVGFKGHNKMTVCAHAHTSMHNAHQNI